GARNDVQSIFYVTVGTGIGGAYADRTNGVHHGSGHTEIGHVPLTRVPGDEAPSVCPYHDHCAEGLTSGPARNSRPEDHPVDVTTATTAYLGQLTASITYAFAPDRIVLGGGVMGSPELVDRVRICTREALNNYSTNGSVTSAIDLYIARAALGQGAGLTGAGLLALSMA
ncbi:MAG: ROK family protein, partial [Acidimicrobiia bacterium]|nr:ROK family protein [Acidimicrobiia bacterium]